MLQHAVFSQYSRYKNLSTGFLKSVVHVCLVEDVSWYIVRKNI
jgi:hypothetical protein